MIRTIERCAMCRALMIDDVEVDLERRELRYRGHAVHLEPREAALLYRVVEARGLVVSAERMIFAIWGQSLDGPPLTADVAVKVYLCRIRAKLRNAGVPLRLVTHHGGGVAIAALEEPTVSGKRRA